MELYAKSKQNGKQPTLAEHTEAVTGAFETLFGKPGEPTRLARQWQRFFKLESLDGFLRNGLAAAALHDIGKANDGFQDEVTERSGRQLIRHEHLSGLLLALPEVREWLESAGNLDVEVIVSAVLSHHLKVSHEALASPQYGADPDMVIAIHWDEPSFQQVLGWVGRCLAIDGCAPAEIETRWSLKEKAATFDLMRHAEALRDLLHSFRRVLRTDAERRRLLWATKAGLIAADAAGSGLVREGKPVPRWLADAFDEGSLCDGERIWKQVIGPRVSELKKKRRWNEGDGCNGWSAFQEESADLPDRALLLAPCGSGKTLAAWRWIAARLSDRPTARVIFLYPTRGTATEGFHDYVSFAPEADAALMHGTARYDLEGMFENPDDATDPRRAKRFEGQERLFALKNWPKRIFSATVDQFLAFLQHGYGPTCQLPLLVDSVIVVDEVHSFDRGMFSALTDFLTTFDVPVLCMTATLPSKRRRLLEETCGLQVHPRVMPADLCDAAKYHRYRVTATTKGDAVARVKLALAQAKCVLWVVNQVARAQGAAKSVATDAHVEGLCTSQGVRVFCYHSRFRLHDRVKRHREVVEAFKPAGKHKGVLAIATQVCEMSLDLDADLLVTEEAPITSLIQRMGRCCREMVPKDGRVGDVLIYAPENERPYKREELEGVSQFVEEVAEQDFVTQNDLTAALDKAPQRAEPPRECRFLTSGPYAMAGDESFRDLEEWTQQAVLAGEVEKYVKLRSDRERFFEADGLVLPVPKRLAKHRDDRLPRYLAVVPDDRYDPCLGFLDEGAD